ncbi:oligosaccharide flippase family protein [Ochrovirga pacifica]|uniref:oligosaccharide flippase family protein n=1 Tax=Ochrovirga pacifica TaxID=1042376 RepID=UPI000255A077|nr:oligosaccharide flippase family protein [Ochrovirga pacifica]
MGRILNFYKGNKKVFENFSYLTLLQIARILLPFVSYPYLIRTLGSENYGLMMFSQALVIYFSLFVNFGFHISATQLISTAKTKEHINEIVSSVYLNKIILWVLCLVVYVTIVFSVDSLRLNYKVYLVAFFMSVNELLFPQWYFQGVEKMKYITYINVGVKLLFTVLVFFVIKRNDDYLLAQILQVGGVAIGAFVGFMIMFKGEKVNLSVQPTRKLIYYFKESLPFFISNVSTTIYASANKVVVGSFLGMTEVAMYDLGEKILNFIKTPVLIFFQAIFPNISRNKSLSKINKFLGLSFVITAVLVLACFVFSEQLVVLIGGNDMVAAKEIVQILVFAALFTCLNQFFGSGRLVVFGYKKIFSMIAFSGTLFFGFCFLVLKFTESITIYSVSVTSVLVEVFIFSCLFWVAFKKKLIY